MTDEVWDRLRSGEPLLTRTELAEELDMNERTIRRLIGNEQFLGIAIRLTPDATPRWFAHDVKEHLSRGSS